MLFGKRIVTPGSHRKAFYWGLVQASHWPTAALTADQFGSILPIAGATSGQNAAGFYQAEWREQALARENVRLKQIIGDLSMG